MALGSGESPTWKDSKPQESTLKVKPAFSSLSAIIPSAIGDRQMFPVHTKRMETKVLDLELDAFIQFFHEETELLVCFEKVVHGPACMQNRCMVFVSALLPDAGQR